MSGGCLGSLGVVLRHTNHLTSASLLLRSLSSTSPASSLVTSQQCSSSPAYIAKKIDSTESGFLNIAKKIGSPEKVTLSHIGTRNLKVTVKEWLVKPGDTVARLDKICKVQSDKLMFTICTDYDGVVTKLYHAVDDIAWGGDPLIDVKIEKENSLFDDTITEMWIMNELKRIGRVGKGLADMLYEVV